MLTDPGYFYNPIKRDIVMIKNDTMAFGFQVQGLGDTTPDFVQFTCKETVEDEDPLFAVSLDTTIDIRSYDPETDTYTYSVRVPPEATANIEVGRYFYDLELRVNGDIITLMTGRLSIESQVTTGGIPPTPPTPQYDDGDNVYYPVVIEDPTLKKIYTEKSISDIADMINFKLGSSNYYTVSEMAEAISMISPQAEDGDDIYYPQEDIDPSAKKLYTEQNINEVAAIVKEKLGSSDSYKVEDLPEAINLLGKLPEKTASGAIASFNDGAANVPVKSAVFGIVPSQADSGDPAPDNVRPISGYTGMNIYKQGKNLLLPENSDIAPSTTNGITRTYSLIGQSFSFNGTNEKTDSAWLIFNGSNFTLDGIKKGATYSFYHNLGASMYAQVTYYNTQGTLRALVNLAGSAGKNNRTTFTIPSDFDRLRNFQIGVYANATTINETAIFQIEVGSTATAYEPYRAPEVKSVSWEDEAGTVYGGSLNLTTGELTVTRGITIYTGSEEWAIEGAYNFYVPSNSGILSRYYGEDVLLCSVCLSTSGSISQTSSNCFISPSGNLNIQLQGITHTVEAIKAYCETLYNNNTPLAICYELPTPITYQLTPEELRTFLGSNNIWSDTNGEAEITYRADIDILLS